jgi:hypothetical protein
MSEGNKTAWGTLAALTLVLAGTGPAWATPWLDDFNDGVLAADWQVQTGPGPAFLPNGIGPYVEEGGVLRMGTVGQTTDMASMARVTSTVAVGEMAMVEVTLLQEANYSTPYLSLTDNTEGPDWSGISLDKNFVAITLNNHGSRGGPDGQTNVVFLARSNDVGLPSEDVGSIPGAGMQPGDSFKFVISRPDGDTFILQAFQGATLLGSKIYDDAQVGGRPLRFDIGWNGSETVTTWENAQVIAIPIPEPATAGVVSLSSAGLWLGRRRRSDA